MSDHAQTIRECADWIEDTNILGCKPIAVRLRQAEVALSADLAAAREERDESVKERDDNRWALDQLVGEPPMVERLRAAERDLAAAREAFAAYRSALLSGEPETDQLRALARAALAAGGEEQT